jgi:hypothetical protein
MSTINNTNQTAHPVANPATGECANPTCPCHELAQTRAPLEPDPVFMTRAVERFEKQRRQEQRTAASPSDQTGAHALVADVVAAIADDLSGLCGCPLHRLSPAARTACIDTAIDATNADLAEVRLANFNYAWSTAPRSMRNYVEREVAEFFYALGQRDGFTLAAKAHNGDLREMGRVMAVRKGREGR